MGKKEKKSTKELEERLKALKREQRRLSQEIETLSKGTGKSSGSKQNSGKKASRKGSRSKSKSRSSSQSSSRSGVEMKSYLSSGSFRGKRELRHERTVQRNKAIFMAVAAMVALYIFFMWIY